MGPGKSGGFPRGRGRGGEGGNTCSLYLRYVFFSDISLIKEYSNKLVSHFLPHT